MKNFSKLYTTSEYILKNPSYHAEDSQFKWSNFEKCLKGTNDKRRFDINSIRSVCEVGCGVGGILNCLNNSNIFPSLNRIEGWDINQGAIEIARRNYRNIKFYSGDVLQSGNQYDLMICADVFEHVENAFAFLKDLGITSKYFLFNVPLEMNLLTMLQGNKIVRKSYQSCGHLHFYSASTATLTLELTGYELLNHCFARNRSGNFFAHPSFKKLITTIPQFLIERMNPYLSSALMGDSLVVLACRQQVFTNL